MALNAAAMTQSKAQVSADALEDDFQLEDNDVTASVAAAQGISLDAEPQAEEEEEVAPEKVETRAGSQKRKHHHKESAVR